MWRPGRAVVADLRGRAPHYADDWRDAKKAGATLVAPTVYIFLASVLPALAFGLQLEESTDGRLGIPHVLIATCVAGVVQSLLGGPPLLIVGVAEPIVVMYSFMYNLVRDNVDVGPRLFRGWSGWVCAWTAVFCAALALTGATRAIRYFTRFAGELFGFLIAVLFMQQAVLGCRKEFEEQRGGPINGLWAVITVFGLPISALALEQARSWRFLTPRARAICADYAAPLMVVAWTALSASLPANGMHGLPRRVPTHQPWAPDTGGWGVASDMRAIPGHLRALAIGPAAAISILFYFDHTVSSQLAQVGELVLARPPAYAYDLLLLSVMTFAAGLFGVPPVNGVLPQAPMHTRALRGLRSAEAPPVEQRLSNLVQALLVGALIPAAPAIRLLPTCVLWAYFAYMSLSSLPGSQLTSRCLLLFTDPTQRAAALEGLPYADVPFRTIAAFTVLQFCAMAGVWALIAFGTVGGIAFPLPILLLLPLRAWGLPWLLGAQHLRLLDPAEYEAEVPIACLGDDTEARADEPAGGEDA